VYQEVFGDWYDVLFDELDDHIRRCSDHVWLSSLWPVAHDPHHHRALGPDGQPHALGIEVLSAVWKCAWHGLVVNQFNLVGRPADFRLPDEFAHLYAGPDVAKTASARPGEVLPAAPPSRDDVLAYLAYNRSFVKRRLAAARDVGDGESTLGPWRGSTSELLTLFHGNALHFSGHASEVRIAVWQHR
jgi:hypothetical protein